MKKNILLIITVVTATILGWLIIEPWNEDFGYFRDILILVTIGLFIVLSMISFNYLYYKKVDLLKQVLKNPLIYILPIVGAILAKFLFSSYSIQNFPQDKEKDNIVMVLDVSSSMGGEPMYELKNAVREFINIKEQSKSSDKIALITFGDEARILSRFTNSYQTLRSIIPNLDAYGSTNMSDGIQKANYLLEGVESRVPTRFLLLTDGKPDDERVVAEQIYLTSVPIDVVGLGEGYDKQLCNFIVSNTGGKFYSAQNIQQLTGTFKKIAGGGLTQANTSLPIGYRILGWVLFGLFLGLAINIYELKRDRIIVGILGGIVAGLFSSLLFVGIDAIGIYGTVARLISFILFAIILAISLLWVESIYMKLSGNNNQFDFDKFKIKNK